MTEASEGAKPASHTSDLRLAMGRWSALAREHAWPLLLYALLSVAVSWPIVRDFSSKLVSSGGDARNNLWLLWHVREVIAGNQALFDMPLLYYPEGINLLGRGLGPFVGLFALPFWPWGPEAAYNGAVLLSLTLSGYFMYLLARGLKLARGPAFFAGLLLLMAPLHLAGLYGHLTKVFLGLIPLTLLALVHALDEGRGAGWPVATGGLLLLTLLHNGYQFVFTSLAIAFFVALAFVRGGYHRRRFILQRSFLTAASILLFVGPLLLAMIGLVQSAQITVDKSLESFNNQPDLAEFFLPPSYHWLVGSRIRNILAGRGVTPSIETSVSLSWTGLLLCGVAVIRRSRKAIPWVALTALSALIALGPSLVFLGKRLFTSYQLPVILPYAFLTQIPGLGFMRAPGRFMMLGYVAFGLAAAFGLSALFRRWPRWRWPLLVFIIALLLLERWPRPWPQEALRPVPNFYQQISTDRERYGVFDLPIKPDPDDWYPGYASFYQMYQMTHGKGIASGYLARVYDVHPVFPCVFPDLQSAPDVKVNGGAAECYVNTRLELSEANYRYVVFHKPQPGDPRYAPGSWGEAQAQEFIQLFFPGEEPLVDDGLATVYAVEPLPEEARYRATIGLLDNWYVREGTFRWAATPAKLLVTLPEAQTVVLEMALVRLHGASGDEGTGRLSLTTDAGYATTVAVREGETAAISFPLPAGKHRVSLALDAGNFRPSDSGSEDRRLLSFAIEEINMRTPARD